MCCWGPSGPALPCMHAWQLSGGVRCLAARVEPIIMSAGELEHEWAGTPGRLIRERYRRAAEHAKNRGKMPCLIINDLDAGIGIQANVQRTVRLLTSSRAAAVLMPVGSRSLADACMGAAARLLRAPPGLREDVQAARLHVAAVMQGQYARKSERRGLLRYHQSARMHANGTRAPLHHDAQVNNQNVFGTLMNIADNPNRVSIAQVWRENDVIGRVPIIVTGKS